MIIIDAAHKYYWFLTFTQSQYSRAEFDPILTTMIDGIALGSVPNNMTSLLDGLLIGVMAIVLVLVLVVLVLYLRHQGKSKALPCPRLGPFHSI